MVVQFVFSFNEIAVDYNNVEGAMSK